MHKCAFLFPGQGAQKCGMGRDFYEQDADARAVFDRASELLKLNLKELIFQPDERLDRTEYTQAAMVTVGIAMLQAVRKTPLRAAAAAGLSLGEYEALYLAGVLTADEAVLTVRERGKLMQEAVPPGTGGMAAVLNADRTQLEEIVAAVPEVWVANYNCPGQIVISGRQEAVQEASERLKAAGMRRIVPLNVSGPFHSGMLAGAGEKLDAVLSGIRFRDPVMPYAANVTGAYVRDGAAVRELLVRQVSGAVRFEQSLRTMIADGIDTMIEIGPGHTLTNFVKRTDPGIRTIGIETVGDLQAAAEEWT